MQFAIEPLGKCLLDDAVFFRIKEQLLISLRVFHISLLCSCVKDTGENTSLINLPIIAFSSFFDFCILAHFCMVRSKITAIRAEKSNMVVFCMDDGSEIVKRWKDRSRAESWTPEMKEKARQRALQARRKKK